MAYTHVPQMPYNVNMAYNYTTVAQMSRSRNVIYTSPREIVPNMLIHKNMTYKSPRKSVTNVPLHENVTYKSPRISVTHMTHNENVTYHTSPRQTQYDANYYQAFSLAYSTHSLVNVQSYHLLLEEAGEIRFTGRSLPFIFYFNQITELLQRCPEPNRKMELLRASYQDEAREAISALVPPVPGWNVDTQIDRALEGLRLRYGCSSFLFEPLVKRVQQGPKINRMDAGALEKLISDLNDCELYARAHKQIAALDSSFIIDIGKRLPFYVKNRYADFLQDHYNNPEQPTFASFKDFLNRELQRTNTTFAQRFLELSKERTYNKTLTQTSKMRVHRANIETTTASTGTAFTATKRTLPPKKTQSNLPAPTSTHKQLPNVNMLRLFFTKLTAATFALQL